MARKPTFKVEPKPVVEPVIEPTPEAPVIPVVTTVTNCLRGTTLHLGDGRKLAFGETADVGEVEAAFLIGRGQAE